MRGATHSFLPITAMAGLLCLAACATQTTVADRSAENAAYLAADFSCTRATSENIGMKLLNVEPARYMDKCIRLSAFTDGTSLYVDASGMKPVKASNAGLYWKDEDTAKHLKLGPSFVTIAGRFRDCAKHNAMTAQAETANPGACKTAATAIFISDVQVVPTAMD